MNVSLATLVPHEPELLEDEIVRTEAELEAVSNKLQRLTQLRQLSKDTEVAKEALDKLASEMAAQNLCHEQIAASLEVLKTQLARRPSPLVAPTSQSDLAHARNTSQCSGYSELPEQQTGANKNSARTI